jgi:hypothetical protein
VELTFDSCTRREEKNKAAMSRRRHRKGSPALFPNRGMSAKLFRSSPRFVVGSIPE